VSGNTFPHAAVGWNSCDSFGASIKENTLIRPGPPVALQPFGWNYVVIDYRWYEPGQPIDANGRYLPATSKYPSATGSNGFKTLADRIHAIGLFGIHIMRGVPRSVTRATPSRDRRTRRRTRANDPCPGTRTRGVRGDRRPGRPGTTRSSSNTQRGIDCQDRRHAE
jgi:hypothetical protein